MTSPPSQTQVSTPLELQAIGYSLGQVTFGGYILSAAFVIFRSTFLPQMLGVLLAIGGLCYLTYSFADFRSPAVAAQLVALQAPGGIMNVRWNHC
jgi:hypothetical protein